MIEYSREIIDASVLVCITGGEIGEYFGAIVLVCITGGEIGEYFGAIVFLEGDEVVWLKSLIPIVFIIAVVISLVFVRRKRLNDFISSS